MKKSIRFFLLGALLLLLSCTVTESRANAASPYMIKINKQQNVVTIYKEKKNGKYKPFKAFVCSTGVATPVGTFNLREKIRWHILDGPTYGQYCTRIYKNFLFHSVWYYEMKKPNTQSYIQYNRLGTTASHGCVRLTVGDAKWIYDHCPTGTKVTIYNSPNPGPLGKPKAIKVRGYSGWDPTDPDPKNPYHKTKPTISGVKNQNVPYDSKFNILKGITVKNSTGYGAKDLLTTTIYHKANAKSKYKKVKELDTKKPGKYKVLYKITDEIGHKAQKKAIYTVMTKVEVKSLTLSKTKKTLYLGGTAAQKKFKLKVKKVTPKNATYQKVTYTSSDPSVATVGKKGVVRAKKAGTTIISVATTDGSGVVKSCKVTVKQKATGLTLTTPGTKLDVGNSMQLKYTLKPADVSSRALTYTSSDETVATVSASGSVKALKAGTVTITAKTKDGSNISATVTITVYNLFSEVTDTVSAFSVPFGTAWDEEGLTSQLPLQMAIKDKAGNTAMAAVQWNAGSYDANVAGEYTVTGTIALPEGWETSDGTKPTVSVMITVEEKIEEELPEEETPEEEIPEEDMTPVGEEEKNESEL